MAGDWARVNRRNPCIICGKTRWCTYTTDGAVARCMQVESEHPSEAGGWIHFLTDESDRVAQRHRAKKATTSAQKVTPAEVQKAYCAMSDSATLTCRLANALGVPSDSIQRLGVRHQTDTVAAFPMVDHLMRVQGIRFRASDGKKWSYRGGREGLFVPSGVNWLGGVAQLLVVEGPTDCAALLSLGFVAIGRPSCTGGTLYVSSICRRARQVVIVADNDPPKERPDGSTWRPGREGAVALADTLVKAGKPVRIVSPPHHKDVRQWLRDGLTRQGLQYQIDMQFFHRITQNDSRSSA